MAFVSTFSGANMFAPTIQEVIQALEPLAAIPRPYGDNEGAPINSDTVFSHLSSEHQDLVSQAEEVVYAYTRTSDGQVNTRAVNTITRHGYKTSLGPSQYDYEYLDGRVAIRNWDLDISDPRPGSADD
jgi:hypothetical protein